MNKALRMLGIILIIISNHACSKEEDNSIRDADGNVYTSVTIGTQVWLVENLKTTRYNNGDIIGTTSPVTLDISAEDSPKYQWAYDGIKCAVDTYGRLYTCYVATDIRGVCPTGWRVPVMEDWVTLLFPREIPMGSYIGAELMEAGTSHWNRTDIIGTNETGFTALPSGGRFTNGTFYGITISSYYWQTGGGPIQGYSYPYPIPIYSTYMSTEVHDLTSMATGFSIRCIKDN